MATATLFFCRTSARAAFRHRFRRAVARKRYARRRSVDRHALAIAVRDDKIIFVGDDESARRSCPEAAEVDLGGRLIGGSPGEFGKLIADETDKWAKVIKFAGIKPQ